MGHDMQTATTLFVYYKITTEQHVTTLQLLRQMSQTLKAQYRDLEIEMMQRPEVSSDGLETWMEVYRYPGGITSEMIAKIAASAQDSGLPLARKVEIFIPLV
jgi:hypothetical protein